ncbi:MAG: tetratricopeptide repeat protein [Acidobacteriota bacterium]|nr:MAG: tetratricopeptide repeat protein [Acidobacteriota bacterium]
MLWVLFVLAFGCSEQVIAEANPLHITPEMQSFFEERVPRTLPPIERLQALVDAMFDEEGLGFRYENATRSAAETFNAAAGDCLSFTFLLIAVGRHLGFDLQFREVEVAPTWSKRGGLVVFNRHVDAVAFIGVRMYLIDLFPQVNAIQIAGYLIPDERGTAHYLNNRGADLFSKGQFDGAINRFLSALELAPDAAFIWANLGAAQVYRGELQDAEQSYLRAISLEEDNMIALTNLATLYEKVGRIDESERLFERVEQFRQKNPYYHFALGEEALSLGAYETALAEFKMAVKIKPKEHHFHHALARAYARLGDMKRVVEHLERAEEYAPDDAGRMRYSQKLEILARGSVAARLIP